MKHNTLDDILKDPEFASLLEVSKEDQELHDSLVKNNKYNDKKQTLGESMAILGYNA